MAHVGVDACPAGWVAIRWSPGSPPRGVVVAHLDGLGEVVADAGSVAIDIPIGLPEAGLRAADVQARRFLGPRRNSVFHTPVRAALEAPTHGEASAISRQLTGRGISMQAYRLGPKLLEAEAWRHGVPAPVWEVHPEVTFAVLLDHPARASKKTWAGMIERRDALAAVGIDLDDLGEAGARAGVDDVLDAAALAWSAHRLATGQGISFPDPPEADPATGEPMAIWA